jgi:hypothetical protein
MEGRGGVLKGELTMSAMIAVCLNCGDCSSAKKMFEMLGFQKLENFCEVVLLSFFDRILISPHF